MNNVLFEMRWKSYKSAHSIWW